MAYRILVMTASIGNGHRQAAAAAAQEISMAHPGTQVQTMDFFEFFRIQTSDILRNAYLTMVDYLPNSYRLLYYLTSRMKPGGQVTDAISWRLRKKVLKAIQALMPHYILFTDPFSAALVLPLKKQGKLTVPMGMVITDYTAHPLWLNPGLDQYFVACSQLKKDLRKRGVPRGKIDVTGIPVNARFRSIPPRGETLAGLGFSPHIPVLLLMGGGLGLGPLDRVLDALGSLGRPLQVIAVTGKNLELYNSLSQRSYPPQMKVEIMGFSTNIHQLMGASDLLISKAGGLTLSEAMCTGLPVIIYDPLPGQEVANARLLVQAGAARMVESLNELSIGVEELLWGNPQERIVMARNCRSLGRPQAARSVALSVFAHLNREQTRALN
jgi:processive 1,2-diacylglycerol beta-glucosyltransferase